MFVVIKHSSNHLLMTTERKCMPIIEIGIPAIKPININFHSGIPSMSSFFLVHTLNINFGNKTKAIPNKENSLPIKHLENQYAQWLFSPCQILFNTNAKKKIITVSHLVRLIAFSVIGFRFDKFIFIAFVMQPNSAFTRHLAVYGLWRQ